MYEHFLLALVLALDFSMYYLALMTFLSFSYKNLSGPGLDHSPCECPSEAESMSINGHFINVCSLSVLSLVLLSTEAPIHNPLIHWKSPSLNTPRAGGFDNIVSPFFSILLCAAFFFHAPSTFLQSFLFLDGSAPLMCKACEIPLGRQEAVNTLLPG